MNDEVERESIQVQLASQSGMLSKYRSSMVGDGGNLDLVLYEVINLLFMPIQSKIGYFLRRSFLRLQAGKIGQSVTIGANCTIRNSKLMFIGDSAEIEDEVTLDVKPGNNRLVLGAHSRVGKGTILNCAGGEINIGKRTVIGSYCRIGSLQDVIIGQSCTIGNKCCVVGAGHSSKDLNKPIIAQPTTCKGANTIGDSVVIGDNVTILNGIHIGSCVTIESNSLVNRDVPDDCTVSGMPAKNIHP